MLKKTNIYERKKEANALRKSSQFAEALPIYKGLWEDTQDAYDGSGYLSCLRKLCMYEEAIIFAKKLFKMHPNSEWVRKEVAWTQIQGQLVHFGEESTLNNVITVAKSVMETRPDFLAKKITVFKVLKHAKLHKEWGYILEWVDLLEPQNLSDTGLKNEAGKEGWSDLERWYNYKINAYLQMNNSKEALELYESIKDRFPKRSKYFSRLGALALRNLGRIDEAIAIFDGLCSTRKVDWWLLLDYGRMLLEKGDIPNALIIMCKAADYCPKPGSAVRLYQELADIFYKLKDFNSALTHYSLAKTVRVENEWTIPKSLKMLLTRLETEVKLDRTSENIVDLLKSCRQIWRDLLSESDRSSSLENKMLRKGLIGRISIISGRSSCFINCKDGLSAICFRKNVPPELVNGDTVIFDAIPSFDKKKNKESWRAQNILPYI